MRRPVRTVRLAAGAFAALAATGAPALAQPHVEARDGESVYQAMCQGCHMPDGRGAAGAAGYPALAGNPRLAAAAYPLSMVVRGRRAMPALGAFLDDEQVAAVVTFVRTRFGNDYGEPVTAAEARAAR
jgi:mono/diheme cytochrome c family protein